jgi:hypothetical protein
VEVVGHTWGTSVEPLHPPFDTVVACGAHPACSYAWAALPFITFIRNTHPMF